jgi:hypothetical protein
MIELYRMKDFDHTDTLLVVCQGPDSARTTTARRACSLVAQRRQPDVSLGASFRVGDPPAVA